MMLHGIIAILIGLAFIFASKELISTIIMIFGILMLLAGIIITWKSALLKNPVDNKFKYFGLLQGIVLLAMGLFVTYYSDTMVKLILLFFGIWAVVAGGFQITQGIKTKNQLKANKLLIINGLVLFLMGLLMVFKHDIFLSLMGSIIGFLSVIIGVISIFFSILFRKVNQDKF